MTQTDVIRTPDQRLRVFVSSTLGELAAERRAVARAISALRLTPVMFELGARPTRAAPPRPRTRCPAQHPLGTRRHTTAGQPSRLTHPITLPASGDAASCLDTGLLLRTMRRC